MSFVPQDNYTLGERLGQGGMGEVYEVTHARLPGRFAVKILRSHLLTDQDAFRRFCRETKMIFAWATRTSPRSSTSTPRATACGISSWSTSKEWICRRA